MKSRFVCRLLAAVVLGLMASSLAWADIGLGRPLTPKEQKESEKTVKKLNELTEQYKKAVPLVFRSDTKAPVSKLIIPRRFLEEKEVPDKAFKGTGAVSGGEGIAQSADAMRTIVAGLAMSLAMTSLILMRKRSRAIKAGVIVTFFSIGMLAAATWSLAGAPKDQPERQPKANGRVFIEIVDDGDSVQFIRGKN